MRLKPFLFAACLLQVTLALAVSLRASPAEACSQPLEPRTFHTLTESIPGDGASNVPLDGILLFKSRVWKIEGTTAYVNSSFHEILTVTVTDLDTGETVPGLLRSWWGKDNSGEVWRPAAPLLPNRSYAFVATLQQNDPRPAEAQGPTELSGSFSTGDQMSPPLEFLGELAVSLESFEQDKLHCVPGLCGCDKAGREVATRARIRVPGVQGGSPIGGYDFNIWVTDNTPYRFDVPASNQRLEHKVMDSWGASTEGEPAETLFVFHDGYDFSYKPCFAWRAVDAAGHVLEGAPICPKDEVHPRGFAFGCSVIPGAEGVQGTAFLALLGALLTVWRVRRRPTA